MVSMEDRAFFESPQCRLLVLNDAHFNKLTFEISTGPLKSLHLSSAISSCLIIFAVDLLEFK